MFDVSLSRMAQGYHSLDRLGRRDKRCALRCTAPSRGRLMYEMSTNAPPKVPNPSAFFPSGSHGLMPGPSVALGAPRCMPERVQVDSVAQ
eukprot:gene8378-7683_t